MMTRQELQQIRKQALLEAECPGLNAGWKRAYEALADAADRLDAMNARCEINELPSYLTSQPPALEIGTECGWPSTEVVSEGRMFPKSIQEEIS